MFDNDDDKKKKKASGFKTFERDDTDTGVAERGADPVYVMDSADEAARRQRRNAMENDPLVGRQRVPSDSIFEHPSIKTFKETQAIKRGARRKN